MEFSSCWLVETNIHGCRKGEEGIISAGGLIRNVNGDWVGGFSANIVGHPLWLANQSNYFSPYCGVRFRLAVDLLNASSCDPLHPLCPLVFSCKAIMTGGVFQIHHVFRESILLLICLLLLGSPPSLWVFIFGMLPLLM